MSLDYFALIVLIFVCITIFYAIIAIHDIPYEIAKKRNHPHKDAIHAAGWVSLFTLHALWPFLWIWATLWRDDRGWGFNRIEQEQNEQEYKIANLSEQINQLNNEVTQLRTQLMTMENSINKISASDTSIIPKNSNSDEQE